MRYAVGESLDSRYFHRPNQPLDLSQVIHQRFTLGSVFENLCLRWRRYRVRNRIIQFVRRGIRRHHTFCIVGLQRRVSRTRNLNTYYNVSRKGRSGWSNEGNRRMR